MKNANEKVEHPLEARLEIPRTLRNELIVREDGGERKYVAFAYGVCAWNRTTLRGETRLEKYTRIQRTVLPLGRGSVFYQYWKQDWVASDSGLLIGKCGSDRTLAKYYREDLWREVAKRDIILSDELLDTVFAPIDAQLSELLRQVQATR